MAFVWQSGASRLPARMSKSSGSAGWKNNVSEENLGSSAQRERYSGHAKSLTSHMQGVKYAEDSESLRGGLRQLTMRSLSTGQPLPQPLPRDKQQTWTPKSQNGGESLNPRWRSKRGTSLQLIIKHLHTLEKSNSVSLGLLGLGDSFSKLRVVKTHT